MKVTEVTINLYVDEDSFNEEELIEDIKERFEEITGHEALSVNVEIEE